MQQKNDAMPKVVEISILQVTRTAFGNPRTTYFRVPFHFIRATALLILLLCACLSGFAEAERSSTTPQPVKPLTGVTPASKLITEKLAQTCTQTDDSQAPAMVVIKPDVFNMGSPATETDRFENEDPQHQVTVPRPFAISRCEITVGQFRQFIEDTGYRTIDQGKSGCYSWENEIRDWKQNPLRNWSNPGFNQTEQHPVVCVSWHDAQAYVAWLSQRTGALYRLPTEAEWEYAARAGTVAPRYFDADKQCDYANGLGQEAKGIEDKNLTLADCSDRFVYTAPVGSFAENQFGLFDMLGNAWEWTLDCWHPNYGNAPVDGSAWLAADKGDCSVRVVRGGSWFIFPQNLRSAVRYGYDAGGAGINLGFRVARAL